MKRALVTGGGGFLGSYIVSDLLEAGWQVASYSRSQQPGLSEQGVEVLRGDLSDAKGVSDACANRDAVFHVAAKAGIWGDPQSYHDANVLGTRHVIDGCHKNGVSKLIYTSSPSVIFDGESHALVDESRPYAKKWYCHYSRTKAEAEAEVLAQDQQKLKTVALRPHLIWGPGDPHLVPRLIERARAGQLARVGAGRNRVDMVHVKNAARAHLLAEKALDSGVACSKVYFITNDEPVDLWLWVDELLEAHGVPALKKKVPFALAYGVGVIMELIYKTLGIQDEPRMTRFLAMQLSSDHCYDISAAKKELGYHPEISMKAGLEELRSLAR